jgi:hypothetical protein
MDKKEKRHGHPSTQTDTIKASTREAFMEVPIFDLELLYVECSRCGQPVLWNPGDTTKVLTWAGVDTRGLDEKCMIVSEGCPLCRPGQNSFSTQIVRLRSEQKKLDTFGKNGGRPAN